MKTVARHLRWIAMPLPAFLAGIAHASCGSAFCAINTDWAAGSMGAGRVFDLRYEYIPQDQPRSGTRKLAVGEIPHHHDEVRTTNRNLILSYSQTFESGWGFSVTAPLVDRKHLHVHNHRGEQLAEQWNFRKLGDVRVSGRRQFTTEDGQGGVRSYGFTFGAKLPTGSHAVANAGGELAERSLQPGSGTTDVVLGAFLQQQLPLHGASWFTDVQVQHPVNSRSGYRPGPQLAVNVGYAQRLGERLTGVIQLNAVAKGRDKGAEAEPDDSGSRSLFLSPGISFEVTPASSLYAFYQHPLHQSVNGVQLTARRAIVVGMSMRF
jgi:hypothetical protein